MVWDTVGTVLEGHRYGMCREWPQTTHLLELPYLGRDPESGVWVCSLRPPAPEDTGGFPGSTSSRWGTGSECPGPGPGSRLPTNTTKVRGRWRAGRDRRGRAGVGQVECRPPEKVQTFTTRVSTCSIVLCVTTTSTVEGPGATTDLKGYGLGVSGPLPVDRLSVDLKGCGLGVSGPDPEGRTKVKRRPEPGPVSSHPGSLYTLDGFQYDLVFSRP